MTKTLNQLWCAMNTTSKDANTLADMINQGLGEANKVLLIRMTDTWYIIAGNDVAKKWYEDICAAAEKQLAKEALASI